MPTAESNLARVLKALLSVGAVSCEETEVHSLGHVQNAYRLTVNSSVILDLQHGNAVLEVM